MYSIHTSELETSYYYNGMMRFSAESCAAHRLLNGINILRNNLYILTHWDESTRLTHERIPDIEHPSLIAISEILNRSLRSVMIQIFNHSILIESLNYPSLYTIKLSLLPGDNVIYYIHKTITEYYVSDPLTIELIISNCVRDLRL